MLDIYHVKICLYYIYSTLLLRFVIFAGGEAFLQIANSTSMANSANSTKVSFSIHRQKHPSTNNQNINSTTN